MNNEHWIKDGVKFTSYNKLDSDIIILKNSNNLQFEFSRYSTNYFKAAKQIVTHLIEEKSLKRDIATLDTWFFALAYLYRQSIELSLKATLIGYDIPLKDIISSMRHNLSIGFNL